MYRFPSGVHEVGKCYHRDELTVTGTAQEITLTSRRKSIEVIPALNETTEIYYGGAGVTSANGAPIGAGKIWTNCKDGFSVYLVVASGTAVVRIAEYD